MEYLYQQVKNKNLISTERETEGSEETERLQQHLPTEKTFCALEDTRIRSTANMRETKPRMLK